MKIAGIICEYNPFHNGHLYHINKTKESADAVVCIMSGSFVQRGFPAMWDKFSRADTAVKFGADLVIELPTVFALSSAEGFSKGGIETLNALPFVNSLSYGYEAEVLEPVDENNEKYLEELKAQLDLGLSFPKARYNACLKVFNVFLPSSPNDILAYEYKKALKSTTSSIIPNPIKRMYCDYNGNEISENYASASYIRENLNEIDKYVPKAETLEGLLNIQKYKEYAHCFLRTASADYLKTIKGCTEGLENRVISCAIESTNYDECIEMISTKRYTKGRIERLIASAILGIRNIDFSPEYIRVLSMSETGCKLLKSKEIKLPIIVNLSKQKINSKALDFDIKATDIRCLFTDKKAGNVDFRRSPRVIK